MAINYNRIHQRSGGATSNAQLTALLAALMSGAPGQVLTSQAAAPGYDWQAPTGTTTAATEALAGLIEIATQAEVSAGTDDARAVTPLKLKAIIDALNAAAIETTAIPGLAGGAASDVQTVLADIAAQLTALESVTGNNVGTAPTNAALEAITTDPADSSALEAGDFVFFPNASTDNGQTRPAGIYVYDGTGWPLTPALALPTLNIGAATDAAQGLVELATNAEVATGTDTTRAVTPAGLASLIATDALRGLVELATDAEAIAGTSTTHAITPANLAAVLATLGPHTIEETLFVANANLTVAPVDADLANPATTLRVVKIDDVTDSKVYWSRAAAPGVFTIAASTDDSIDTSYYDIEAADGDPLNVIPTVGNPTVADVVSGSVARRTFVPSGRVEVFTHDGLAWIADYVVDPTDDDAPEILPLATFPTAVQAFTPSVHGTLIRMRHAQAYTVTRTNDADAGTDPSVEVPAPTTDAWVTINYPTAPSEYFEWDGAAWVPNTTGATSPGRWDTNMPSLAAGERVTYYADVGPDFASATGYSVGIGGDNVADPDKSIRINLPAGSTLQGSAQANEYAELTQVGESITIIGLGNDDYVYENHPPLVQLDSSSVTPATDWVRENLTATAGQQNYTLASALTPQQVARMSLSITGDGGGLQYGPDYTVAGSTLTLSTPLAASVLANDNIQVTY